MSLLRAGLLAIGGDSASACAGSVSCFDQRMLGRDDHVGSAVERVGDAWCRCAARLRFRLARVAVLDAVVHPVVELVLRRHAVGRPCDADEEIDLGPHAPTDPVAL